MIRWSKGFWMSMGMFCAIPLPFKSWDEDSQHLVLPTLPLVGVVVGGIWAVGAWLISLINLHQQLAAALIVLLPHLMVGFIHLDGYMDTCDAVLSRRPLAERRRILKDSHTGAFAVIMLAMLLMLEFASVTAILDRGGSLWLCLPIAVISRSGAALGLFRLPTISAGFARMFTQQVGRIHWAFVMCWIGLSFAGGWWLAGFTGIGVLAITALGFVLALAWAYRALEGVSGDVAGFSLIVGELCGLMALAIL